MGAAVTLQCRIYIYYIYLYLQRFGSDLVDDVDAVVNPLPPEDRVEVVEPVLQVIFSVTERDDDGHLNNKESWVVNLIVLLKTHFNICISLEKPFKCITKSMAGSRTRHTLNHSWGTIGNKETVCASVCFGNYAEMNLFILRINGSAPEHHFRVKVPV